MTPGTLLTPAGVAAVAVIGLERTEEAPPLRLTDARGRPLAWPAPGRVLRARLMLADRPLDDVLVVGRDPGAELHVHGGAGVVRAVLEGLAGAAGASGGAGSAAPPVAPAGLRAARAQASVLHGELHRLRGALSRGERGPEIDALVSRTLANAGLARRLERPATVRIVGSPNVGKSTLFNALLMEDRALVSPEAGTTRDAVSSLTHIEGVAVRLEDTEGGAPGEVRRPGADLLVHVLSAPGEALPEGDPAGLPLLRVLGKVDTLKGPGVGAAALPGLPGSPPGGRPGVSGRTGQGVAALRARIGAALGLGGGERDDVLAPLGCDLRRLLRRAAAERRCG